LTLPYNFYQGDDDENRSKKPEKLPQRPKRD